MKPMLKTEPIERSVSSWPTRDTRPETRDRFDALAIRSTKAIQRRVRWRRLRALWLDPLGVIAVTAGAITLTLLAVTGRLDEPVDKILKWLGI